MALAAAADRAVALFARDGDRLRREGLETEWLLTNSLGGFAMGTMLGTPTRRYHGLLVAAMRPPVDRVNALTAFDETLIVDVGSPSQMEVKLTPFHFVGNDGAVESPTLTRFERGTFGCRWRYRVQSHVGEVEVERTLYMFDGRNAIAVRYAARSHGIALRLNLRPLMRLGDFHNLRRKELEAGFRVREVPNGVVVTQRACGLHMHSGEAAFRSDAQWWDNLTYWWEKDRGLDHVEDLFSPGIFEWTTVPSGGTSVMTVYASTDALPPGVGAGPGGGGGAIDADAAARDRRLAELTRRAIVTCGGDRVRAGDQQALAALARGTDQFVVKRGAAGGAADAGMSVIAGYPWFSDWGRDTMIGLPGLFLVTGRHEEARKVLEVFAENQRNGIIPNRFDDRAEMAHYNTIDASLWYIHAACAYAKAAGGVEGVVTGKIGKACEGVIEAYVRGTDFGIRVDAEDGLVMGGDANTQLTWMDAKRDGVVFTPRAGKCIEINALWHSGLVQWAELLEGRDGQRCTELRKLAQQAGAAIRTKFWNEKAGCLFDRLEPGKGGRGWSAVGEIRPNQVFAVSLAHSPLTAVQQKSVLAVVKEHLLTRHGLRTLSPRDSGYKGRFEGPMFQRDGAYHNGTVWPWLIGPYVEALLRVHGAAGVDEARRALAGLIEYLDARFPGQLPEVFDGDDTPERPQRARGCIAQAWSVAEVLRALVLVVGAERT